MTPLQLALTLECETPTLAEPPCAFGHLRDHACRHHCQACAAHVDELCREFQAAVTRGDYDVEGYTPAERRAQQRRCVDEHREGGRNA